MFVRSSKLKEAHEIIAQLQEERRGLCNKLRENAQGWERANTGWQTAYDLLCETRDQLELMQAHAAQLAIKLEYALNNNAQGATFTQDEINTLISLCHPDKHRNSDRATVMTQRLLELRK